MGFFYEVIGLGELEWSERVYLESVDEVDLFVLLVSILEVDSGGVHPGDGLFPEGHSGKLI